jgi:DNA-binding transcriptional LysR family regulator
MLQLHRLQSFVAVVDTGSFTAAAASLGLSKAVISLHVKQLEEELGSSLLARTTRKVLPTDAGERLHRSATRLLQEADAAEAEVRGAHTGLTGTLRITSHADYIAAVLVPALATFSALHPRLRLEISGSTGQTDLVRERFDLAIRLGTLRDSTLQATRLGRFRLVPVATPELVAGHGLPRVPEELTRLPWTRANLAGPTTPDTPIVFRDRHGAEHPVVFTPAIRSDSAAAVLGFVRAHVAAAILPDWLIKEDLARGRLVELVPGYDLPEQGIFAVRPRAGQVPGKVRAFLDFSRSCIRRT